MDRNKTLNEIDSLLSQIDFDIAAHERSASYARNEEAVAALIESAAPSFDRATPAWVQEIFPEYDDDHWFRAFCQDKTCECHDEEDKLGVGLNSDVYGFAMLTNLYSTNNQIVAEMHIEMGIPVPFTQLQLKSYFIDAPIELTKERNIDAFHTT